MQDACGPAGGRGENEANNLWAGHPPPCHQHAGLPARLQLLQVTDTPAAVAARPPVSCPSRLQLSPARRGSEAAFDPFAPPAEGEQPGCTPMCAQPAAVAAPPAVHRRQQLADGGAGSPVRPALAAELFAGDQVQSCPPERVGRRGARPLVRIRVKRSLTGAVAAAAGSNLGAGHARRSMDAALCAAGPPAPQLAGCSRKRFEAELMSPPLPRKSSRMLLDDQQAADMISRLQLGGGGPGGAAAAAASVACCGPDGLLLSLNAQVAAGAEGAYAAGSTAHA